MRVAVNTRFLLKRRLEGFGRYTEEIVRRMVHLHPDWEFIFFFDRAFDPRFVYGPNVKPVVLFPQSRHAVLWYWWFEWSVPAALKKYGADVFFSPDSYLSLTAKTPTLMTVHDLVPLTMPDQIPLTPRLYYQHYLPKFIQRADHILTVSDFVRAEMMDLLHVSGEKITTVYNGCRTDFVPLAETEQVAIRQQYSDGLPYFFYTGAIHPRKNIDRLINAFDAFKTATGAPVNLLLAGRFAWQTGAIKSAWERARHRSSIRFLDYVPDHVLPKLMASALALTYISRNEGFGLPIVEAFNCDTPVITSNATALPEVAGPAALLVNPDDDMQIQGAINQVWQDSDLRNRLISAGRERKLLYDWDKAATQIAGILDHIR